MLLNNSISSYSGRLTSLKENSLFPRLISITAGQSNHSLLHWLVMVQIGTVQPKHVCIFTQLKLVLKWAEFLNLQLKVVLGEAQWKLSFCIIYKETYHILIWQYLKYKRNLESVTMSNKCMSATWRYLGGSFLDSLRSKLASYFLFGNLLSTSKVRMLFLSYFLHVVHIGQCIYHTSWHRT